MPPFPTRVRAALYGALAVRFTASEDHTESPWGERKKAARAREATEVVVGIAESVRRAGRNQRPPEVAAGPPRRHLELLPDQGAVGRSRSRKRKYQVTAAPRPCL